MAQESYLGRILLVTNLYRFMDMRLPPFYVVYLIDDTTRKF